MTSSNRLSYWLMKSEPTTYSIDDLQCAPKQTDYWDGVRNYQARNMMRDQMQPGDLAFFYHSNCKQPAIVGTMKIVRAGYADDTAFDPESPYYDPKSTIDNPRWYRVDVKFQKKFKHPISLHHLKHYPELEDLVLLRKGNRLSIMPVTQQQWDFICQLT